MTLTINERFKKKVSVDQETGCHVWNGAKVRGGYGHFRVGKRMVPAHRWIWESIHGQAPSNMKVCHSCNNASCVNPAHLYLDTHSSNMTKMGKLGRLARGAKHGHAKLEEADIVKILDLYNNHRYGKNELGRMFGVTSETIAKVVTGKRWRHVTN